LGIGGRQPIQPGEVAPQRVRLLLGRVVALAALLGVNISAEIAQSGMSMPMSHMTKDQPQANNSGLCSLRLVWGMTVPQSVNLLACKLVIDTQTNQPATDVILKLKPPSLSMNGLPLHTVVSQMQQTVNLAAILMAHPQS